MDETEIVDEAILSRRSVRAFLPDPVDETTIREILEIASRAPSGTNMQPWRVYVTTGRDQGTHHATPSSIPASAPKRPSGTSTNIIPRSSSNPTMPPARRRLRALRPSRHRQARRRPDARAARPQLRLLRRAGRDDLHHRPQAEPGLMDRLRHVPAEHHGRGAGEGPAHLPAGGVRALSPADQAGARHSRRRDRRLRHGARLRGRLQAGKQAAHRTRAAGRMGESFTK